MQWRADEYYDGLLQRCLEVPAKVPYSPAWRNGLIASGNKQAMNTIHICICRYRLLLTICVLLIYKHVFIQSFKIKGQFNLKPRSESGSLIWIRIRIQQLQWKRIWIREPCLRDSMEQAAVGDIGVKAWHGLGKVPAQGRRGEELQAGGLHLIVAK